MTMESFTTRLQDDGDETCAWMAARGPVYLLTGLLGNLGDHLIWAGTERLLSSRGVRFRRLPLSRLDRPRLARHGCLVIPGSGAWSPLFHEWLPSAAIVATRRFRTVLVLGSEFHGRVPVVAEALSRPNLYVVGREQRSYAEARPYGRARLGLDPALHYRPFVAASGVLPDNPRTLLCLRTDQGSRLVKEGWMPDKRRNNDISVTSSDLAHFLAAIQGHDVVVTDRLHCVVAAVMYGKSVRFVDPYDEKISTYVQHAFGQDFAHILTKVSDDWLAERGFIARSALRSISTDGSPT